MTWEAVTAITELVGLTVVVASVIYIAIQTKQTNAHATASSEIEWINAWNQILNNWVSDERTTSIIRRGFYSFEGLEPSEQAVFHMRIGALVNQWVMVRKLTHKIFFVELSDHHPLIDQRSNPHMKHGLLRGF